MGDKQNYIDRAAGILLPIFSLPSKHGIGTFGREAYRFVDFLYNSKQTFWQVLPLGPTSFGDSPYQSFSAFAGNTYFIDLDLLVYEGLLKQDEIDSVVWNDKKGVVDYSVLYNKRKDVLFKAFERWEQNGDFKEYDVFCEQNSEWLDSYAVFMTLKERFGEMSWQEWPDKYRIFTPELLEEIADECQSEIRFINFCQFQFSKQWNELKTYANSKGIQIIGDIPIYVAMDSADVWANSELFQLDKDRRPTFVAGVPPDLFSKTGQLWGNPLYRWDIMKQNDFSWWRKRMKHCAEQYDVIRIDHFIGIVNYYSIPADADTAEKGKWIDGPGLDLIEAINESIGDKKIIAENLGAITEKVTNMLVSSGYPGMKVIEFGLDADPYNDNLPSFYEKNCIAYTGTHDNETLLGFIKSVKPKTIKFLQEYFNCTTEIELMEAIIRSLFMSAANVVIVPLQDYLCLDNESRINFPGTIGGNWIWRFSSGDLSKELQERIKKLTLIYARKEITDERVKEENQRNN